MNGRDLAGIAGLAALLVASVAFASGVLGWIVLAIICVLIIHEHVSASKPVSRCHRDAGDEIARRASRRRVRECEQLTPFRRDTHTTRTDEEWNSIDPFGDLA